MIRKFYEIMDGGGGIDYEKEYTRISKYANQLKEENKRLREALIKIRDDIKRDRLDEQFGLEENDYIIEALSTKQKGE